MVSGMSDHDRGDERGGSNSDEELHSGEEPTSDRAATSLASSTCLFFLFFKFIIVFVSFVGNYYEIN